MKKNKKIALMLPRFSHYGGVEGIAYRLAKALADKGYEVDFICSRQETPAPEGVRVFAVGRYGLFRFTKMLWYMVRAEQIRRAGAYDATVSLAKTWNQDISRAGSGPLQVFWRLSQEAWPQGWRRTAKKISRYLQPANWLTFLIEKRTYHTTPCIIAISGTVRGWIEEIYPHLRLPSSTQQLMTIYNRPDLSLFTVPSLEQRLKARQALHIPEGQFALGIATTNFALKGVSQLITALSLLPEEYTLHIAGGRKHGAYVALAEKLGITKRVVFHGKVDTMPQFYQALDMFVLPTFYDTLGNVALEAMACGVKTLCSDRAGASAFLPDDQILHDPGDPSAIAHAIATLRNKTVSGGGSFANTGPNCQQVAGGSTGVEELVSVVESYLEHKEARACNSTPHSGQLGVE